MNSLTSKPNYNVTDILSSLERVVQAAQQESPAVEVDGFTISDFMSKTGWKRSRSYDYLNRLIKQGKLCSKKVLIDGHFKTMYYDK